MTADGDEGADLARKLEQTCAALGSVVVAYSGGVDSAVVLGAAVRALGGRAIGVLALSPSFPSWEVDFANAQAVGMGAKLVLVKTAEVEDPRYAANARDRCFYCKSALFDACEQVRATRGFLALAYGANRDDLLDDRPGHLAAHQRGVRAPLLDAGFGKEAVRALARHYQIPSAEKPALACLSSRFPHGTAIDAHKLSQVDRAERAVRELGFQQVRVRYLGETARIEVGPHEVSRLMDPKIQEQAVRNVQAAGFARVTVDPQGYRMGGANPLPSPRLPLVP
jgi:uncharacterized protein